MWYEYPNASKSSSSSPAAYPMAARIRTRPRAISSSEQLAELYQTDLALDEIVQEILSLRIGLYKEMTGKENDMKLRVRLWRKLHISLHKLEQKYMKIVAEIEQLEERLTRQGIQIKPTRMREEENHTRQQRYETRISEILRRDILRKVN